MPSKNEFDEKGISSILLLIKRQKMSRNEISDAYGWKPLLYTSKNKKKQQQQQSYDHRAHNLLPRDIRYTINEPDVYLDIFLSPTIAE